MDIRIEAPLPRNETSEQIGIVLLNAKGEDASDQHGQRAAAIALGLGADVLAVNRPGSAHWADRTFSRETIEPIAKLQTS